MNLSVPQKLFTLSNFIKLFIGVGINLLGLWLSYRFLLPVRLNCIGTMYVSCMFGPIGGVATAIITTLLASITNRTLISYLLQTIVIGALCGRFYTNKKHEIVELIYFSFLLCITGTFLAIPCNLIFHQGHTGNRWGDALFDMMMEQHTPMLLNSILGELLVEFPEMILSVFLTTGYLYLRKHFSNKDITDDKEI